MTEHEAAEPPGRIHPGRAVNRRGRRSPARPPTGDAARRRVRASYAERRPLALRQEVADYLRVPIKTLAQWAYWGIGPPYRRVGRHTRYCWADVDRWLEQQRRL